MIITNHKIKIPINFSSGFINLNSLLKYDYFFKIMHVHSKRFFKFYDGFRFGYIPHYSIIVRFDKFDIQPDPYSCSYDSVSVYNGNRLSLSNRIGRFCGKAPSQSVITSNGTKLTVNFVTDGSGNFQGFSANYTVTYGKVKGYFI